MQRFISQFSFSLGEHRLVRMAPGTPEQQQPQLEAQKPTVESLERAQDALEAAAKRTETAAGDTAKAGASVNKTLETSAKLDVPQADTEAAAKPVVDVLAQVDTAAPATTEGPKKSAERSPDAVRMQKEMTKQMDIRENQKMQNATDTFAMSRFGKVDRAGNPYLYKTDVATVDGKEGVKVLVAFTSDASLQYMVEGETTWRKADDAMKQKYAPDIAQYKQTVDKQKEAIDKEKGPGWAEIMQQRNVNNAGMETFLRKPDAQTSDFNKDADYWEGLENGGVRVSIEESIAGKNEPATEAAPAAKPEAKTEMSPEMKLSLEYARNSLTQIRDSLGMGHGMDAQTTNALDALNRTLTAMPEMDRETVIKELGLNEGIAVDDSNNNVRYEISYDKNERVVVNPVAAPTEKKPEAPKPADTKPEAPKPAEGMTQDKIDVIKNSTEYQKALEPIRKGIGDLIDVVMRDPKNTAAITAKTKEITDSFAALSNDHKEVMIATYDEQNTVDFAKEGYRLVIKFNPKTPSVTIDRQDLPASTPKEGSPATTPDATPAAPAEAKPGAPTEAKPGTPGETSPAAPAEGAAETSPADAVENPAERIKKIDERLVSIDKDLKETDPAPSEERKQEMLAEKQKLEAEKKTLESVEKVPETQSERLQQQLDASIKKLENAKSPAETFAALMEVLATVIEFVQRAFNGTLDDKLDKPKDVAGDKKEGADGKTALATKLDGELKDRAEKNKEADPAKNREGLKKEKLESINKNKETLKTLDKDVETTKEKKKTLLKDKMAIETQLTDLSTDESKAPEVQSLKTQLASIEKQIAAMDEAIVTIDKQRDELAKANRQLETEVAALDSRETGLGVLENVLGRLNALLKEKGLNVAIKIEMADGKNIIVLEGLTAEQAKLIDPTATEGKVSIDPLNPPVTLGGTDKKSETPSDKPVAKPAENTEVKESLQALTQRREYILGQQINGLLKGNESLGLTRASVNPAGNQLFETNYMTTTNFYVLYNPAVKQWTITNVGENAWKTPDNFIPKNGEGAEAVRLLKNFNRELANLDEEIAASKKREQVA